MAGEERVTPRQSVWVRPLPGPAAGLTGFLSVALVMGLAAALFEIAGVAPGRAFALAWPVGIAFLVVRQAITTRRWPTARGWLGLAVFAAAAFGIAAVLSR